MADDEVKWEEAPHSVIHIAEQLINKYHQHLKDARIAFVMRSEEQKAGDQSIIGQASKVPAKMQPYLEFDFLIWLAEDRYNKMSDGEREAMIDHELTHCGIGMQGWTLRKHDINEFAAVIERHGLWSLDLRVMDKAVETYHQGKMPFADTKVTMSGGGKVVSLTGKQLEQVAREVSEKTGGHMAGERPLKE